MITQREHRLSGLEAPEGARTTGDDVTASEIAAFVYCAKAWHLERVVGVLPSAGAARARAVGTTHHARHGAEVRAGSWLGRNARQVVIWLLLLALVLAALSVGMG